MLENKYFIILFPLLNYQIKWAWLKFATVKMNFCIYKKKKSETVSWTERSAISNTCVYKWINLSRGSFQKSLYYQVFEGKH